MAPNFKHLLQKPADDIKKPPVLPEGTYFGQITGQPTFGESSQKKTPFVQWTGQYSHAADDVELVDEEGMPINLEGKKFYFSYYLTEDALWRLVAFVQSCGINTEGRSLEELLPQVQGKAVQLSVVQRPNKDETGMVNNIQEMVGVP